MDSKAHEEIYEDELKKAEPEKSGEDDGWSDAEEVDATGGTAEDAGAETEDSAGAENAQTADAGGKAADAEAGNGETAEDAQEDEPEEGADSAQDGPEPASDGKWHVFGRKKEKKDPKDQKIEDLTDQLKRQMAEFDNFRKRTEKEKSAMFEVGARSIIEKMLPVIDNFERGLATVPEDAKGTPFAEGMDMIYKQLLKNLEEAGVKPIEAVGQPFDPNFHNAVMHVEDENLGENVVAQEFQKGYIYRDTVVRHSMVQVAN